MKKLLLTIFAILIVFTFSACHEEQPPLPEESGIILIQHISDFKIVIPDEASEEISNAANSLAKTIADNYSEVVDVIPDTEPESTYEIIIGPCARDAAIGSDEMLRLDDYKYSLVGTKLIVTGGSDAACAAGVKHLARQLEINGVAGTGIVYDESKHANSYKATYTMITVNGTAITDFTIVYPALSSFDEKDLAEKLAGKIASATGYTVKIVSDEQEPDGSPEIRIGITSRDAKSINTKSFSIDQYRLGMREENIVLYAKTKDGMKAAFDKLYSLCFAEENIKDYKNNVVLSEETEFDFEGTDIKVMSFNVYCQDMTSERIERVLLTIETYMPDLLGVQEATPQWIQIFHNRFSDVYEIVGEGREGGNLGEYSAVLYNKNAYTLIESGTKWMSETPDVPNSKHENSAYPRIFTYALLERKSDGFQFLYINTHLDHKGEIAKKFQAEAIVEFLEGYSEYPIILTGDFNSISSSAPYLTIRNAGYINTTIEATEKENIGPTFHNYGSSSKILDYCFTNGKGLRAVKYKVVKDRINGSYPSDHYPVYVELEVSK